MLLSLASRLIGSRRAIFGAYIHALHDGLAAKINYRRCVRFRPELSFWPSGVKDRRGRFLMSGRMIDTIFGTFRAALSSRRFMRHDVRSKAAILLTQQAVDWPPLLAIGLKRRDRRIAILSRMKPAKCITRVSAQ